MQTVPGKDQVSDEELALCLGALSFRSQDPGKAPASSAPPRPNTEAGKQSKWVSRWEANWIFKKCSTSNDRRGYYS